MGAPGRLSRERDVTIPQAEEVNDAADDRANHRYERRRDRPTVQQMNDGCNHLDHVRDVAPSGDGCEDCLRIGGQWVHLRLCMSCGHVDCCDDSPNRHATDHFRTTAHPIIQSYEPREDWWYCYVDDLSFIVDGAPSFAHT